MAAMLLIFIGGGIGATARYGVSLAVFALTGSAFPLGTLLINITGSTMMGMLAAWLLARGGNETLRLFAATGLLGGYTTFSAFSLDAVALWQRGEAAQAIAYVVASVGLSIAGLLLGLWLVRAAT